jgi:hypothetical protein
MVDLDTLGRTKDGYLVIPCLKAPDGKVPLSILKKALARISSGERDCFVGRATFRRAIGFSNCVKTRRGARLMFATRRFERGPSRFVVGREPEASRTICCVLKRRGHAPNKEEEHDSDQEEAYILVKSYIGQRREPEPWNTPAHKRDWRGAKKALAASLRFWGTGTGPGHALIWTSEPITKGSETNKCPWKPRRQRRSRAGNSNQRKAGRAP